MMWGGGGCPWCGYGGTWGAGGWLWWLVEGFFGLLILIGLVLLVISLIRSATRGPHMQMMAGPPVPPGGAAMPGADPATAVARERYARGEITKDELDEIIRTLQGS